MMALVLVCDRCEAVQSEPSHTTETLPNEVPLTARERATAHGWQVRATLMQPDLCPVCVAELTAKPWAIIEETA